MPDDSFDAMARRLPQPLRSVLMIGAVALVGVALATAVRRVAPTRFAHCEAIRAAEARAGAVRGLVEADLDARLLPSRATGYVPAPIRADRPHADCVVPYAD